MSRYTDTDELLKAMDTWDKFGFSHSGAFVREPDCDDYVPYVRYEDMVNCVKNMPTADVQEVKHGKWEPSVKRFGQVGVTPVALCSVCGVAFGGSVGECAYDFAYCPNCGAKMGEGREND